MIAAKTVSSIETILIIHSDGRRHMYFGTATLVSGVHDHVSIHPVRCAVPRHPPGELVALAASLLHEVQKEEKTDHVESRADSESLKH